MLLFLLLYSVIGVGLAIATLSLPGFRRVIDRVADRAGIEVSRGRKLWLVGTIIAWPIGLYVVATGRLVVVGDTPHDAPVGPHDTSVDEVAAEATGDECTGAGRREHLHQPSTKAMPPPRKPSPAAMSRPHAP